MEDAEEERDDGLMKNKDSHLCLSFVGSHVKCNIECIGISHLAYMTGILMSEVYEAVPVGKREEFAKYVSDVINENIEKDSTSRAG